ncbi:MAG: winged helix-turn-helix domain-containing protein [Myxococcota bacterium]
MTVFEDVAACLGDRTRAAMLDLLMDGRAHTATELSLEGGVSPSTASSHLSRLEAAGLIAAIKQGRHRYFRVASIEVAEAVEQLGSLGVRVAPERGPRDPRLRRARVCYDHLAGRVSVQAFRQMWQAGFFVGHDFDFQLSEHGRDWFARIGLPIDAIESARRPARRACLDWSERRPHLAGGLGAAFFERLSEVGYLSRDLQGRGLELTEEGEAFLERLEPTRRLLGSEPRRHG